MQIYIDTAQTKISTRNKGFFIQNKTLKRIINPKKIDSIAITTDVNINAAAIKLAAINEIPIYFYNNTGNLIAQLIAPGFLKHARLRKQQLQFMNSTKGMQWAVEQLLLKTKLQIKTLNRASNKDKKTKEELTSIIDAIKDNKEKLIKIDISKPKIQNTVMGLEGGLSRLYFQGVNLIIPEQYRFAKRSRQPGKDYYNTAINYLYGMTYSQVSKAVQAAGLDAFAGALHTSPFKESLVFDSIEAFRPIIDRLLIKICKDQLLEAKHFKAIKNGYWLSKEGKRLLIPLYAEYLQKRIKFEDKVNSIQNHIYWQLRKLKIIIQNQENNVSDIL